MPFLNGGNDITATWSPSTSSDPAYTTGYKENGGDIGYNYAGCSQSSCPDGYTKFCSGFPSTYLKNGSTMSVQFFVSCESNQ